MFVSVSVCLPVWLSAVCVMTMYAQHTNFQDDLDLDEFANDLSSDFLGSCINSANSVVE